MRPVRRRRSPEAGDFDDYRDAFKHLVSRLGSYCSYCERRVVTQLAVVRRLTAELAAQTGFFSIWMTVFAGDADMRNRLIDAFDGTRDSGCFDPATTEPCSPAPNPDGLPHGGKV